MKNVTILHGKTVVGGCPPVTPLTRTPPFSLPSEAEPATTSRVYDLDCQRCGVRKEYRWDDKYVLCCRVCWRSDA